MDLAILRTLLIDGDGVLWRGDRALPGLHRFYDVLKLRGIRWALLTNNNTRTVGQYLDKLAGLGIQADASQVYSSSTATADYLNKKYGPGTPVHAVGMSGVIDTLVDAGFQVSKGEAMPDGPVTAVVAGMDRDFTYAKADVATRLILGGEVPPGPGAYYPSTILTDVGPGMAAYEEELFGPVAAVIPVRDEAEALRVANDTVFGLGAAVFTEDLERGTRIAAEELEAGACFVNAFVRSDPRLPFGGVKESGYGRELSPFGILEFVNIKTVWVA